MQIKIHTQTALCGLLLGIVVQKLQIDDIYTYKCVIKHILKLMQHCSYEYNPPDHKHASSVHEHDS